MTKLQFEGILASKNVPNIIKANTLRQLGKHTLHPLLFDYYLYSSYQAGYTIQSLM